MARYRQQICQMKHIKEGQCSLKDELEAIYQTSWQMQHLTEEKNPAQELISVLEQKLGYEYGAVLLIEQSTGIMVPYALSPQEQDETFVDGIRPTFNHI